jgi:hypothetical protein
MIFAIHNAAFQNKLLLLSVPLRLSTVFLIAFGRLCVLELGNYPVFGVQPSAQVNKFTSLAAEWVKLFPLALLK